MARSFEITEIHHPDAGCKVWRVECCGSPISLDANEDCFMSIAAAAAYVVQLQEADEAKRG